MKTTVKVGQTGSVDEASLRRMTTAVGKAAYAAKKDPASQERAMREAMQAQDPKKKKSTVGRTSGVSAGGLGRASGAETRFTASNGTTGSGRK